MTHSNLSPVEKALASLKRPINKTAEDIVPSEVVASKKPVGGWSQLARTGEHHHRQVISHR